ncbi:MAG: hypothetical protein HYT47_00145 [Candidatus Vogelbacteria bacterium]|nr:hypothetical protein [Candidatus Vogelbacteria bacterium]
MNKGLFALLEVLVTVESGGNDWVIGDRHLTAKAYGLLQVRQPVCDDYNRAHGTNHQARDLPGNRKLSKKICKWYLMTYGSKKRLGREPTAEDLARIWNGGPRGWQSRSTVRYWQRVKARLKPERSKR